MDQNNKRIAKNSLVLYSRMFFVLGLGLLSSRYILESLGIEEYGIYNVVAGVVSFFSFISVSMNSASSRFITASIGLNDLSKVKITFKAAITVHILIALVLLLFTETVGLWFVLKKLVIPAFQFQSAIIAYQIAIVIATISVVQTPFSATLIAYENMNTYATVEIINVILKFFAVLLLFKVPNDRLVTYMIILMIISILVFTIYAFICKKKYPYLQFGLIRNKSIIFPMLSFSGWDLYGNMSVAARSQGVNMLLNVFFGPILNAASGIAGQVQSAIVSLSSNVVVASKPQIIKSYISGDIGRCVNLLGLISKFTTALLLLVCIPIMFNMDYILRLWLKEVPSYTAQFAIWSSIFAIISNLSFIIMSAIHATGKIKKSSLWNGTLYLLVIPISYFAFKSGGSPSIPFIINSVAVTLGLVLNLHYLSVYIDDFKIFQYLKSALFPIIIIILISFCSAFVISAKIENPILKLITIILSNFLVITLCCIFILFNKSQRRFILTKIRNHAK